MAVGRRVAVLAIVTAALFLLVEGLASVIVISRHALELGGPLAERAHVRYDPELGWVNIPSRVIEDLYGRSASLRTNAQGFRNDHDFPKAVPDGRVRVICSGDSFTLGYGVSNNDAWCNMLETFDRRLEAVNMGQGGYGIDQAWLWYRRDGVRIDHDIHLFTFTSDDFSRMRSDEFLGYPKPVLAVENGRLVVRNVPVPHRSTLKVRMYEASRTASEFRLVQLFRPPAAPPLLGAGPDEERADPLRPVVEQVLASLRQLHAERGSTLVLVYLPGAEEYGVSGAGTWRTFAADTARRLQIDYIDLVPDLNEAASAEVKGFFFKVGEIPYLGAEGHYTVRGNRFIADKVYQRLSTLPATAERLRRGAEGRP
jgi:hypothetical protein